MPYNKDEQARFDKTKKLVDSFVKQNDFEGLYEFIYNGFDSCIKNNVSFFSLPEGNAVNSVIEKLLESGKPKEIQFIKDFYATCLSVNNDMIAEVGRKYDSIKKQYENGEIEEAKLVKDDKKTTDELALLDTTFNTEEGRRLGITRAIPREFAMLILNNPNANEISNYGVNKANEKFNNNKTLSKEQKEDYLKKFAMQMPSNSVKDDLSIADKKTEFIFDTDINNINNKSKFITIPSNIVLVTSKNTDELKQYKEKIQNDYNVLKRYYDEVDKWKEDANKYLQQLRNLQKEVGKDNKDHQKLITNLEKALENTTLLGKDCTYYIIDKKTNKKMVSTAFAYTPKAVRYTLNDVIENAEELGKIIPGMSNLTKEIINSTQTRNKKVEEILNIGAERIFDENIPNKVKPEVFSESIKRIEKRQEELELENKFPKDKKDFEKTTELNKSLETARDKISVFALDSMQSVRAMSSSAKFFEKDWKKRGVLNPEEHKEYCNLCDSLSELSNSNVYQMNPEEFIKKLTQVQKAAEEYIITHDLVSKANLHSGRERLKKARHTYTEVTKHLKNLIGKYDEIKKGFPENKSILDIYKVIDKTQENNRTLINDRKKKLMEEITNKKSAEKNSAERKSEKIAIKK